MCDRLQAHLRICVNIGITTAQLRALVVVLGERVDATVAESAQAVLTVFLAAKEGARG
jgi:4-carboxymuconolactone decarboxylase